MFSIKSFHSGRKRKPCKSVRRRTPRSRTLRIALERRFFGKAPKRSSKQRPSRVSQVPARRTVSAHPVRTRRLRAWPPRSAPGAVDSAERPAQKTLEKRTNLWGASRSENLIENIQGVLQGVKNRSLRKLSVPKL